MNTKSKVKNTTYPEASAPARKAASAADDKPATLQPIATALTPLVDPMPRTIAQANVAAANPGVFSLANIRVDQDFATTPGLTELPIKPAVRRPGKQEFFRVHPDAAYMLAAAVLIDETEDKTPYLLVGGIHHQLPGEFRLVHLHLAVTLQGTKLIIPATIPGWNGEAANSWHLSMANAIEVAKGQWTRMRAVKSAGGYQLAVADGALAAHIPKWPTETFEKLLELAFADKFVDNLQHPLVQRLFGHA